MIDKYDLYKIVRAMASHKNAETRSDFIMRKRLIKQATTSFPSLWKASECLRVRLETIRGMSCPLTKVSGRKETVERNVNFFYKRPDVSVTLGGARSVAKDGTVRSYLQQNVKDTHERYINENTENDISFSHFARLRPRNVKLASQLPMQQSVCEKCANVDIALKSLSHTLSEEVRHEFGLTHKHALLEKTLCSKGVDGYHEEKRYKRTCGDCGTSSLKQDLYALVDNKALPSSLTWYRWQLTEHGEGKSEAKSTKKRMDLVSFKGDTKELFESLVNDLDKLAQHIHIAKWQEQQFNECVSKCKENELIEVMDFGQNYLCVYQQEAQGAHWAHNQVTIHPIVTYYKCPAESCSESVREDFVCITSDLKHDHLAVKEFEKAVTYYLENERGLNIQQKVQFTDGCAGQYKSVNAFKDIASDKKQVVRNYFGSRHGKGPADAVTGFVKGTAKRAVRKGEIIRNAEELFHFTAKKLNTSPGIHEESSHKYVTTLYFEYIERKDCTKDVYETVKGTRNFHSVANCGNPDSIKVRHLTCNCGKCDTDCVNGCHTQPFRTAAITKKLMKRVTASEESPQNCITGGEGEPGKVVSHDEEMDIDLTSSLPTDDDADSSENSQQSMQTANADGSDGGTNVKLIPLTPVTQQTIPSTSRKDYFVAAQLQLQQWRDEMYAGHMALADFQNRCTSLDFDINSRFQLENKCPTFLSINGLVDGEALKLPYSCPGSMVLYPALTLADGDCLAHCVTTFTNATTEEVRVRMTIESITQEDYYLDHEFLNQGHDAVHDLPATYEQYSDHYTPGEHLDHVMIRRCFEKEVLSCLSSGTFMGIWQLHAIASIMEREVYSVYPNDRGLTVRGDLNRRIQPRLLNCTEPAHILWTSTRNDEMTVEHWIPNHFVPLLPNTIGRVETSMSFTESEHSFSFCRSEVASIIETLGDENPLLSSTPKQEFGSNSIEMAISPEGIYETVPMAADFKVLEEGSHIAIDDVGGDILHITSEIQPAEIQAVDTGNTTENLPKKSPANVNTVHPVSADIDMTKPAEIQAVDTGNTTENLPERCPANANTVHPVSADIDMTKPAEIKAVGTGNITENLPQRCPANANTVHPVSADIDMTKPAEIQAVGTDNTTENLPERCPANANTVHPVSADIDMTKPAEIQAVGTDNITENLPERCPANANIVHPVSADIDMTKPAEIQAVGTGNTTENLPERCPANANTVHPVSADIDMTKPVEIQAVATGNTTENLPERCPANANTVHPVSADIDMTKPVEIQAVDTGNTTENLPERCPANVNTVHHVSADNDIDLTKPAEIQAVDTGNTNVTENLPEKGPVNVNTVQPGSVGFDKACDPPDTLCEINDEALSVGQFVIVQYDKAPYLGRVTKIEHSDIKVKCLSQHSESLLFSWPKKTDICWYDKADVLSIINPLSVGNNKYELDEAEWMCVINKHFS